MKILFDNYAKGNSCNSLWGFAAYLEQYKLLFDTGSNGRVLLQNIQDQDIDVTEVEYLFITHDHWDHIGGIDSIVELNPNLTIYAPATLSKNHIRDLKTLTKEVLVIGREPVHLFAELYSTGLLGEKDPEHSLIIADHDSPMLLTGCGHYGISNITQEANKIIGRRIKATLGGFHLLDVSREAIVTEIDRLKSLGVEYVMPTHCTGDLAIRLFREFFANGFVEGGVGHSFINAGSPK